MRASLRRSSFRKGAARRSPLPPPPPDSRSREPVHGTSRAILVCRSIPLSSDGPASAHAVRSAQDITVGAVIGIIVDDAASVAAFKDFTAEAAPAPAAAAEAPPAAAPAPAAPAAAPAAPAAAATPAPTVAVSGAALPTAAGRIYWNPEKGWFRA